MHVCDVCGRRNACVGWNGKQNRYECKEGEYFEHSCAMCGGQLTGTDTLRGHHDCGECRS